MVIQDVDMDERVLAQLLALPYRFEIDGEGHIVMTPLEEPGLTWEQLATTHPILPDELHWKVETNARNQIIMSPKPSFTHQECEGQLMKLLNAMLPEGLAMPECPVKTNDGTKIPDVVWISNERRRANSGRGSINAKPAPEICIEVISPSNTQRESNAKKKLYFEAGASEVWRCELDGKMNFYAPAGQINKSRFCPAFPEWLNPLS